jgi:hypothetical protein
MAPKRVIPLLSMATCVSTDSISFRCLILDMAIARVIGVIILMITICV